LGIPWPGQDFALPVFAGLFLGVALATASVLRRPLTEAAR
jgi:Ca2+/H+ antiporter, TMEM165/GDT1 family